MKNLKGAKLVNHWSMSTLSDGIGGVNLNGLNYIFDKNRFNSPAQAIKLSNGYLKVEQKQLLSPQFSVTAWIKLNANKPRMGLLYFADFSLVEADNIRIDFIDSQLHLEMTSHSLELKSPFVMESGVWHHLAIVVDYNKVNVYINGLMVAQQDYKREQKAIRPAFYLKYIGNDNKNDTVYLADATLDELKIFDGALHTFEVYKHFLQHGMKFKSSIRI